LELDKKKMLLDVVWFFNEYQVEYGYKGMNYIVALQIWKYLCNTPNILFQILKNNFFSRWVCMRMWQCMIKFKTYVGTLQSWELSTKL
jgi:hypothetical protein